MEIEPTTPAEPHVMIDDDGELFYPDSEDDAYAFMELHGARYVHPNGSDWKRGVTK